MAINTYGLDSINSYWANNNPGLAMKSVIPKTVTAVKPVNPFGGYVSDTNTKVTNLSGTTAMPDISSNIVTTNLDGLGNSIDTSKLTYVPTTELSLGDMDLTKNSTTGDIVKNASDSINFDKPIGMRTETINGRVIGYDSNGKAIDLGSDSFFSKYKDAIDAGINVGMIGLSGLSYMQNKKVGDKQIDLLTQQINNNAQEMARRNNMVSQLSSGFGGKSAGGNL